MTSLWQLLVVLAAVVGMSSTASAQVSGGCVKDAICDDCVGTGIASCAWSSNPQGGCSTTACNHGPQAVCVPTSAQNCTTADNNYAELALECRAVGTGIGGNCHTCNNHNLTVDGHVTSLQCMWADVPLESVDAAIEGDAAQCHFIPPESPYLELLKNTAGCTANVCDLQRDGDCLGCLSIPGCSYSKDQQCFFGGCTDAANELGYSCQFAYPGFLAQNYCLLRDEAEHKAGQCHLLTSGGCAKCTEKGCRWRPAGNQIDSPRDVDMCVFKNECHLNVPNSKLCMSTCPSSDDEGALGGGYVFLIILFVFTIIGVTAWIGKRYVDNHNGLKQSGRQLVDAGQAGGPTASSNYGSY